MASSLLSTDAVLKKLADHIEAGDLGVGRDEVASPASASSQPASPSNEARRLEMQERRKLLFKPLSDVGVLSYRVNRAAIAAALRDEEAAEEEAVPAAKELAETRKEEVEKKPSLTSAATSWRSEIADLKTMVGMSLSSLVSAATDRTKAEISASHQAAHANLQIQSLTQGVLTEDVTADFAVPKEPRPRADFAKPVKPRSRSERAARFAAHGVILRKNVLPWKATPSRPVKFSLLDPDELANHPGLVDGGDPWSSVFWASKAGDIHAGCHYRPIILLQFCVEISACL